MCETQALLALRIVSQQQSPVDAWLMSLVCKALPRPRGRFLCLRGGAESYVDAAFPRRPTRLTVLCRLEPIAVFWHCSSAPKGRGEFDMPHQFCACCRLRFMCARSRAPWKLVVHVDPLDETDEPTILLCSNALQLALEWHRA